MIRFEKRPQPSRLFSLATPLLAVMATMVFGGFLFAVLGKDPVQSIVTIFWEPLFGEFAFYYRPQLLIKGAPLVLIAIGLALGFKAGVWNIGAEGQYIMGAIFGAGVGLAFYPTESPWIFPLMILAGAFGGWMWATIPAILKVKFGTNEILVSLMLVYVAEQFLASMSLGLLKNPEGFGFPGSRNLQQYASAHNTDIVAGSGMHWGVVAALIAVIFAYVLLARHRLGFAIRVTGEAPRAARFGGVNPSRLSSILPRDLWHACWSCWNVRSFRTCRTNHNRFQCRLWFHCDHRCLLRPPSPHWYYVCRPFDGPDLYRRRYRPKPTSTARCCDTGISRHAVVLSFGL